MMAKESPDIPNNMRKVSRRFERWRSAHTGRLPFRKACGAPRWNWLGSMEFFPPRRLYAWSMAS
jgi:hypothetical protein